MWPIYRLFQASKTQRTYKVLTKKLNVLNRIKMKQYSITKERCKEMIQDLVCPCCGKNSLEPIETVDNSDNPTYWSGCHECGQYSWGVKKEIYRISEKLVKEHNYVAYSHLGGNYNLNKEELDKWNKTQISGTHSLVYSFLKIQSELES